MVMKRKFIGRMIPRRAAGGKLSPKKAAGAIGSEGSAETVCGLASPFAEPPVAEEPSHAKLVPDLGAGAGCTGESETVCGDVSPFAEPPAAEEPSHAKLVPDLGAGAGCTGESETVCGDVSPFSSSPEAGSSGPETSTPADGVNPAQPQGEVEQVRESEAATVCGLSVEGSDLPASVEAEEADEGATVCGGETPFADEMEKALESAMAGAEPSKADEAAPAVEAEAEDEGATICGDMTPFEASEEAAPGEEAPSAEAAEPAKDDEEEGATVCGGETPFEIEAEEPAAAAAPAVDSGEGPAPVSGLGLASEGRRMTMEAPIVPPVQKKAKAEEKEQKAPEAAPEAASAEASQGDKSAPAIVPDAKSQKTLDLAPTDTGSRKQHAMPTAATKSGTTKSGATKSGATKSGATKDGLTKDGKKGKKNSFAFQPGDMVNHYELIRLLGKGGMGSVFLARDTKLGRRVAIKFLHTKDKDLAKRFILEARTTARVGHENIVIIYEADEYNGMPYMALEYLQGSELTKLINDQPMPPGRVAELMVPVLRALVRAHSEGIVHRDLKPDNVMLTDSGTVKVMDFGISKVLEGDDKGESDKADKDAAKKDKDGEKSLAKESAEMTRAGAIVGTLAYMSPEQWRAKGIDHRTDLWAAGIMLFRMLSGRHPLEGKSGMELAIVGDYKHQMPSLREFMPQLPNDLIDLVDKSLAKRKEKRWENAADMLEALEAFLPGRARKLKVDQSPYAGLSAFQEADADRFFGRNNEIAAVVNRIRDQALLGIVGASGSGKSSIVRAGVLPALKRSGENWECLVIRPGRNPIHALSEVLSPMSASLAISKEDADAMEHLERRIRQEPGYAGSLLRNRARQSKCNQLLFIDQFEELYTQVSDLDERLAFTASLTSIADDPSSPTRVILSIRSDFLDRVAEDMVFMNELSQGLVFLIAPNRNGLRDAIVQPAEMAGFTFESEDIVNEMLDHLASTPGALPLLQFAASKLWDARDMQRKMLTVAGYRALGGIAGALATHADAVLNEFPSSSQDLARAIFLRLITPERTRAIVSMSELDELSHDENELKRVINQLVQARLLVVQTSGGNSTVEIVHESLVHTWPTLKRWLDETGEDAPFLEALRNATKQWQAKDLDKDQLWHGKQADEAERFLEKNKLAGVPDAQLEFLHATVKQKHAVARRRRILQMLGGAFLLAIAVGASVMALFASQKATEAEDERQRAQQESARAVAAKEEAQAEKIKADEAAVAAKKSQEVAEQALADAKEKEKARDIAEAKARQAARDLEVKNRDLAETLKLAEKARLEARRAQVGAERNARLARKQEYVARQAEERALKAAEEVAALLLQEQERVQRLQDQLGSPVIDDLK